MTGVDLSSGMLAEARKAAQAAHVEVTWVESDAALFVSEARFDAAICLCEGAFGLLGCTDEAIEQPLAILQRIGKSLKDGKKALFTVLNGLRMVRQHTQAQVDAGSFDPLSLSYVSEASPSQSASPVRVRERGFVPTELELLFRLAGMKVLNVWGGSAGARQTHSHGLAPEAIHQNSRRSHALEPVLLFGETMADFCVTLRKDLV